MSLVTAKADRQAALVRLSISPWPLDSGGRRKNAPGKLQSGVPINYMGTRKMGRDPITEANTSSSLGYGEVGRDAS